VNDRIDSKEQYLQAIRRAIPLARTADERFDLHMALGDLLLPENPGPALEAFSAAEGQVPGSAEATAGKAEAHLTSWRLEEAETAANEALSLDPEEPRAHYILAILLERTGNHQTAVSHYRRAAAVDSDLYQVPLDTSEGAFYRIVEDCLAAMSPETTSILERVSIACEDLPVSRQEGSPPPQAFASIETEETEAPLPPCIILYRRNLLRGTASPAALRALLASVLEKQVVCLLRRAALPPPPRLG